MTLSNHGNVSQEVDLLGEMDGKSSEAVLSRMDLEEAQEARIFLEYAKDCAGGLMISGFSAPG